MLFPFPGFSSENSQYHPPTPNNHPPSTPSTFTSQNTTNNPTNGSSAPMKGNPSILRMSR